MKQTYDSLAAFADRDAYLALNIDCLSEPLRVSPNEIFWETRALLLGALQAAEHSTALTAQSNQNSADRRWGNYALYDCTACHHELRLPSARQETRSMGTPGRPRLLDWPSPLLDVVLPIADPSGVVSHVRQELFRSVNETPFGDPATCIPTAQRLQTALSQVRASFAKVPVQALEARQVLRHLTHISDERLLDYHSARQVIWAI